jgi:hypothetical protein
MSAEAACQRLNDWGAQVVSRDGAFPLLFGEEITWLDVIDDALGLVVDQEWADDQAEEAQAVVQGILTGHVPLKRLVEGYTVFENEAVPWLIVIDKALGRAQEAFDDPPDIPDQQVEIERIEEVHTMVQGILIGHVPLGRLLQPVSAGEGVSQIGGEADNGQRATG